MWSMTLAHALLPMEDQREAVEKPALQSTEHLPYMRRTLGPASSQTLEGARGGREDLPGPARSPHPGSGTVSPGFGTEQLCCLRQRSA